MDLATFVPPIGIREIAGPANVEGFLSQGQVLLGLAQRFGGLDFNEHILEIGCGGGRFALPVAAHLGPNGQYLGFDPIKRAVDWCQEHMSQLHPNVSFRWVDVANAAYNPSGTLADGRLTFPCGSAEFDLAVAFSVFTHMMPPGVIRYISESRRILRPQGRLFATFFFLDSKTWTAIESSGIEKKFRFPHRLDEHTWTGDVQTPEHIIGYDPHWIQSIANERGFPHIRREIGTWSSRPDGQLGLFQDLMVFS